MEIFEGIDAPINCQLRDAGETIATGSVAHLGHIHVLWLLLQ
jgi:hypothetical protein